MSRIGKQPIPVPKGVKVEIKGNHVKVSGGKGSLERTIRPEIGLKQENDVLIVSPRGAGKRINAFWGLTRTLLNNMIVGVDKGFEKKLIVEGIGYRAKVEKAVLTLNVGYSNPVDFKLPEGISAEVDKNNMITLGGIDKELLGLTAARIRAVRKPEPYKGKGIRYEGEHIVRKVGKAGAK
ncbi:MAG: 50S ribosomal protein L6 [Desulfobulbaceae bacterium]|jgi:large subunit ribosomal protein L6|nr:50S ribosomal protein L6 [Desulfobulbaceae bacterium]MDY0349843.1 50S ribosomal protein L6 [Desulfobulbaceae bacterium]